MQSRVRPGASLSCVVPYIALVGNHFVSDPSSSGASITSEPGILLGNLTPPVHDTSSHLEATPGDKESRDIANGFHVDYYPVCAYTGYGIRSVFDAVAHVLLLKRDDHPKEVPLKKSKNYCFCFPKRFPSCSTNISHPLQ